MGIPALCFSDVGIIGFCSSRLRFFFPMPPLCPIRQKEATRTFYVRDFVGFKAFWEFLEKSEYSVLTGIQGIRTMSFGVEKNLFPEHEEHRMNATTTQPKTLDALLAEGRRLVAKQEQLNRARDEERRIEKQASWETLLRQARNDMPSLVQFLPAEMPEDFGSQPYEYTFAFRPFGASLMTVAYLQRGENWEQSGEGSRNYTFWIQREFRPQWNGETKEWEVSPKEYSGCSTNNLAEAVAMCDRATEAYRQCEQECAAKSPPSPPVKAKEPELRLSPSERDFVLALRRVIGDRIPE